MNAAARLFALVDSKFPEQKDFAAQLGITPSIVSEWRRGKSESFTKQKYIGKIAEVLHTTTEYILTGQEEKSTPPKEADWRRNLPGFLTSYLRRLKMRSLRRC